MFLCIAAIDDEEGTIEKTSETNTVLIIEDDTAMRTLFSRVLELEGYRALQAEDGDAGLRWARQSQVALVILDLQLPTRSGWEVLKELKTDPVLSGIPVVVITASAGVDQRDRALSSGAADYLTKPVSVATFRKACADVLRRKG